MTAIRIAITVLLATLLSGCGMSEYKDVSAEPKYHDLIGQNLEAISDLRLHAVTLDRNYAKHVDTCVITTLPGFSGPEVIFQRPIPAGTEFQVLAVRECTNCPFEDRVDLVIRLEDQLQCSTVPVTIDLGLLKSSLRAVRGGLEEHT
jgi:hypothetical protein